MKKAPTQRTAADILFAILIVIVSVILGVCFIHSEFLRLRWINLQLNRTYGISISYDNSRVGKQWTSANNFSLQTTDGVVIVGTCNFLGKIETESYVNCYYADESVEHIKDEIGSCFDDCIVINDLCDFGDLCVQPFELNSIGSYDEYLERTRDGISLITINVLLRESENIDHVADAIRILRSNNEEFKVRFLMLPDNMYDAHLERGVYFYSRQNGDFMQDLINSCGDEYEWSFHMIIGGPSDYQCGIYSSFYKEVKIDGEWVEV